MLFLLLLNCLSHGAAKLDMMHYYILYKRVGKSCISLLVNYQQLEIFAGNAYQI